MTKKKTKNLNGDSQHKKTQSDECAADRFRRPYGPRPRVTVSFPGTTRTKQSFKDECDINNIMARFQKTGAVAHSNANSPRYADATSADFHTAMNLITNAQSLFNDLPSTVRQRFHNDPGQFLDFVQDPDNAGEAAELGLRLADASGASEAPEGEATSQPIKNASVLPASSDAASEATDAS